MPGLLHRAALQTSGGDIFVRWDLQINGYSV
jgi:hypothetical protein